MKHLRKTSIVVIVAILMAAPFTYAQELKNGLTWYTDIEQVYALSTKTGKPVFAFFTGSDWCGWCHRMEKNVFDKDGFKAWAQKNVILLELDFPREKEQSEKLKKQNQGLQQFFKIQGYPTVWMFYMSRDEAQNKFSIQGLGSLGYPRAQHGKEEEQFLANANKILKNK